FIYTIILFSSLYGQEIQEVALTPGTSNNQVEPRVSASDDCFFVPWEDYRSGSTNANIYGYSVYPDATLSSIHIICTASNNQTGPTVEYDSSTGEFRTFWFDLRTASQIYAFDAICSEMLDSEWMVDDITTNLYYPEVAFSGTNYLYVWMYNSGSFETRYIVLDASGSPVGGVQTLSGPVSKNPDVAFDGYEFLAVWEDSTVAGKGIYGRYFDSSGNAISSSFLLVDDNFASAPAVCGVQGTSPSESRFAIAWQHYDGTTNADIYAALLGHLDSFTVTGSAVCTESEAQAEPDIGYHQDGFLVVWKDRRPVFTDDIYGRFLDASCNPAGSDFAICDSAHSPRTPKIDYSPANKKYFCVWTDNRNGANDDIYGALIRIPSVVVNQPNGGETLIANTTYEITWESGWIDSVKINYSTDSGSSWSPVISGTPSDGSYLWTVPNTISNQCLVKIMALSDTNISDISDSLFTIAEPDTYELVGVLENISATKKVEVSGNYAFLPARYNGSLQILAVDVSDSSNPIVVASTDIPAGAYGMGLEILDTLVSLSTSDNKLHNFHFQGDTLVLLGSYDISGQGAEVVGTDTMVWVIAYDYIRWLSIADPASPYELANFSAASQFKGLCLQDTFLFSTEDIISGGSRFRVLRANHPSNFQPAGGSVPLNGYGEDVAGDFTTGYMFVADGVTQATNTGRMISIDVTNLALPESTGIFESDGASIKAIDVSDTIAYLANDTLGVKVVSVANPSAPYLLHTIDIPAYKAMDVFIGGRFLYVLTDSSLLIYRINIDAAKMNISSWVFGDSSDGDGYFEPSETLGLTVVVENTGTETLTDAWIRASILSGDATIEPPDSVWFGDIPSGEMDTAYYEVLVNSGAAAPSQIEVLLEGHNSNDGDPVDTAIADIIDTSPEMSISSWVFGDSSDGDGYFEPGETLGLTVEVENIGMDTLHDAWIRATILSGDGSILGEDSVWLGDIDSTEIDSAYFEVKVGDSAPTPSQIQVLLAGNSSDGGEPKDTAIADIVDVSPIMDINSWTFSDSSDEDGRFEPGETLGLEVIVENIGLDILHNAWMRINIISGNGTILGEDSVWFGTIDTGATDTGYFIVEIDGGVVPPDTLEVELLAHSSDGGDPTDTAIAEIVERLPELSIISWEFSDSSDEDGRFEPGETLGLEVIVENTGLDPLHDAWIRASVLSGDGVLEMPDSIWFGDLAVAEQETAFYSVIVDTDAVTPSTLEILLESHSSDGGDPTDTAVADIVSGSGGFSDDMESGIGDWNPDPNWRLATWDASSPMHSWFCGREETPLYDSDWDESLISPWITVPGNAQLVVHHRYNLEDDYDYGYIAIDAGGGWITVDSFTNTSNGWERWTQDLSAVSEGDSIRIRFRLISDGSVQCNGWWIDDVYVGEPQTTDLWGQRCYPIVALFQDSISFSIYYQREDGTFPTSARVIVEDSTFELTTSDFDVSDGALYSCKVRMDPWNYNHHYEFEIPEGIIRFPASGEIPGPFVNDTVAIFWHFEDVGHAVGTGSWEYGTPTSGPGSAHSGNNLWATDLSGNYPNNDLAILTFQPFDLTGMEHPQVRMWLWYSMQARTSRLGLRDAASAWVITDTDTIFLNQIYEYPRGATGYTQPPVAEKPAWGDDDQGNFWYRVQFDLSPWAGDTISFSVIFVSNNWTNEAGIYIDDVALLKEFEEPDILHFVINSSDSVLWEQENTERGETVYSTADDSLSIANIGNVPLDILMGIFDFDTDHFNYVDTIGYGCFSMWGHFTQNNTPVDTTAYNDSLDWIFPDTLILSDTLRYGPGGWNIPPDSVHYLWLMMHTPPYFSQDTISARIFLKALMHIE
ncbi:hypothetical protein DRQ33_03305, partial [bacterium]